jgi:hypothetical protein
MAIQFHWVPLQQFLCPVDLMSSKQATSTSLKKKPEQMRKLQEVVCPSLRLHPCAANKKQGR